MVPRLRWLGQALSRRGERLVAAVNPRASSPRIPGRIARAFLGVTLFGALGWPPNCMAQGAPPAGPEPLEHEIGALRAELDELHRRERGILAELEALEAERRVREKEERQVAARLEEVASEIARHDSLLARLDGAQEKRRSYLDFRLREIYKAGPDQLLARLLAGDAGVGSWSAMGYASLLSERDARVLADFRGDTERSHQARAALAATQHELAAVHTQLAERRDAAGAARRRQAAALAQVRADEGLRRTALQELEQAAGELGRLAGSLEGSGARSGPSIRGFKGLLDWPTDGELTAGFGTVVHPEFKTRVPHPGWDIAAPFGADIAAIHGGRVLYAGWMRGYGLTAIVDHGDAVFSIYSHASVLLVQEGDELVRGQVLGQVGESGSLRGPYLYFELRVASKPEDPALWLRRR